MDSGNTTTTDNGSKEVDQSCSSFEALQINSIGTSITSSLSTRSTQRWRLLSRAVRSKTYELFDDEATTTTSEMPSSGISSAGSSSSGLSYPYYYPYRSTNESLKPSTSSLVSYQSLQAQRHFSPPISPESVQGDSDNELDDGLSGSSCSIFKISTSVSLHTPPQQQPYGFNIKTYGFMKYVCQRTTAATITTHVNETCADVDECANLNERWIKCKWNADVIENDHQMEKCKNMNLQLKLVENRLTFQDLAGFDNSGNVRIWPCEELLAYLVTFGVLKDKMENKVVLEIGAGMTALAGLTLVYLNACRRLYLTDGNRRCIKNIETIVDRNFERIVDPAKQCAIGSKFVLAKDVHVQQLRWGIVSDYQHLRGKIEVIIGADILFVSNSHADLLNTIDTLLVEHVGSVFILSPSRGKTCRSWIDFVRSDGRFSINMFESFCSRFASIYHELYKQNPHGWNHDAYFPFLLVMTRNLCDLSRVNSSPVLQPSEELSTMSSQSPTESRS